MTWSFVARQKLSSCRPWWPRRLRGALQQSESPPTSRYHASTWPNYLKTRWFRVKSGKRDRNQGTASVRANFAPIRAEPYQHREVSPVAQSRPTLGDFGRMRHTQTCCPVSPPGCGRIQRVLLYTAALPRRNTGQPSISQHFAWPSSPNDNGRVTRKHNGGRKLIKLGVWSALCGPNEHARKVPRIAVALQHFGC